MWQCKTQLLKSITITDWIHLNVGCVLISCNLYPKRLPESINLRASRRCFALNKLSVWHSYPRGVSITDSGLMYNWLSVIMCLTPSPEVGLGLTMKLDWFIIQPTVLEEQVLALNDPSGNLLSSLINWNVNRRRVILIASCCQPCGSF